MIKDALVSFKPAAHHLFKDKINFLLALIPVIIGILLYYFFSTWLYGTVMDQGQIFIDSYISEGTLGKFVYYLVAAILSIMMFFLVNWTFVLVVSIVASPFNDMLSSRIEKKLKGKQQDNLQKTFKNMMAKIVETLFTEVKKVSFIIFLSALAVILGFFPILTPLSVFISVLLLAIEFLDYSWSRHELSFGKCFRDLRKNLIGYGFGGAFFFMIVSIPLINLIVPPLATSYFTHLWIKNNEYSN